MKKFLQTYNKIILKEDAASQEKRALNILQKAKLSDDPNIILDKLKTLSNLYQNSNNPNHRSAKNYSHLPKLAMFYAEKEYSIDTIADYYRRYMEMPHINDKTIERFPNFRSFEVEIDANFKPSNKEINRPISSDEAIYKDSNITVFLGDTMEKCINYGQRKKYGLCISTPDISSNFFHSYRKNGLTTYFVYFNDTNVNPPANFIIVDNVEDDTYSYNIVTPNRDIQASKEEIIKLFPQLTKAFSLNVFKQKPIEGDEKEYYEIYLNGNFSNMDTFAKRLRWVNLGLPIFTNQWVYVKPDELKYIIPAYIEQLGNNENPYIPEELIYDDKLKARYYEKIKQTVDRKIESYTSQEQDFKFLDINSNLNIHQIKYYLTTEFFQQEFQKEQPKRDEILKIFKQKSTYNKELGLYELNSNDTSNELFYNINYALPDLSQFIWHGNINLYGKSLVTLKGFPKIIKGGLDISRNLTLFSLEGAPEIIEGPFEAIGCNLESTKHMPKYIGKHIILEKNKIKEITDFPKVLNGPIDLSDNPLQSLEGLQHSSYASDIEMTSGCRIIVNDTKLTSLKYLPENVGIVYANRCQITSLEGLENLNSMVSIYAEQNKITTLKHIDGLKIYNLTALHNLIESLECPNANITHLSLMYNKLKNLIGCPQVTTLRLSYNPLESLEGCPKIVTNLQLSQTKLKSFQGGPIAVEILNLNHSYDLTDYTDMPYILNSDKTSTKVVFPDGNQINNNSNNKSSVKTYNTQMITQQEFDRIQQKAGEKYDLYIKSKQNSKKNFSYTPFYK